MIRKGDWKLIESLETDKVELYNLKEDLGEKKDLAPEKPEMVRELREMLAQWRKQADVQMPKPSPKWTKEN